MMSRATSSQSASLLLCGCALVAVIGWSVVMLVRCSGEVDIMCVHLQNCKNHLNEKINK